MPDATPVASPASTDGAKHEDFEVELRLDRGYAFHVDLLKPEASSVVIDEEPPLGEGTGITPVRALASAVAACLGSSLLFCLRKARVDVQGLKVVAAGSLVRNARGRLRVGSIRVRLEPEFRGVDAARVGRCQEIFEDFCTVTESVKQGIDVQVEIAANAG